MDWPHQPQQNPELHRPRHVDSASGIVRKSKSNPKLSQQPPRRIGDIKSQAAPAASGGAPHGSRNDNPRPFDGSGYEYSDCDFEGYGGGISVADLGGGFLRGSDCIGDGKGGQP